MRFPRRTLCRAGWLRSLALGAAVALAACTPAPSPSAIPVTSTQTAQPAVTASATPGGSQVPDADLKGITLQVWHPWFGTDARLFETMVEEFNNKSPWGFQVAATGQVSYSGLYESVTTALPTDKRPNLVIGLPEQARVWDADGYVVDLAPYVNDPVHGWTADEIRDIPAPFWLQDAAGERRVALPFQRSARFLLWNKTWAQELGFDAPPSNPDDFRDQACRATQALTADDLPDNDGTGGWLVDTEAMTALSWMQAFEGGVVEGDGYRFLTPNNITTFTFLRKLQEDGCAWMGNPELDPLQAFAERHALFLTAALEQFPDVMRAFGAAGNTDEWVPLAFPGETKDVLVAYGSSLVMLKSDEPTQLAAWLFMDWLLSPENDARAAKTTGLFPIRSSSLGMLGDYAAGHPQWKLAVDLIPGVNIQPQLASWRKVRVMLGDGFTQMFRVSLPSGQVPAVLAQMQSTAQDLSH